MLRIVPARCCQGAKSSRRHGKEIGGQEILRNSYVAYQPAIPKPSIDTQMQSCVQVGPRVVGRAVVRFLRREQARASLATLSSNKGEICVWLVRYLLWWDGMLFWGPYPKSDEQPAG